MLENKDKINWISLSSNPNAIDLLKKNIDKIHWFRLSRNPNPNAIELLRERIEYENSLTKEELDYLNYSEQINWSNLAANPNAIDLLKERIEYEKALADEELDESESKIDWYELSSNSAIFKAV